MTLTLSQAPQSALTEIHASQKGGMSSGKAVFFIGIQFDFSNHVSVQMLRGSPVSRSMRRLIVMEYRRKSSFLAWESSGIDYLTKCVWDERTRGRWSSVSRWSSSPNRLQIHVSTSTFDSSTSKIITSNFSSKKLRSS